jgi:uncharacterized peroxidase-related enzyme
VKRDYRQAALEPKMRKLLDFAVQVTRELNSVRREAVDELRAAGWTDVQILDAVQVIGFFNYITRVADALGVDPEDFMRK